MAGVSPVAGSVPFDNSSNGFTSDEVQSAIEEAKAAASGDRSYVAGENISALQPIRIVGGQAFVSKNTTFDEAQAIGIAVTSASIGNAVTVRPLGDLADAFFSAPNGASYFVSPSGQLTDVPPVSGFLTEVARSTGVGSVFIQPRRTIVL